MQFTQQLGNEDTAGNEDIGRTPQHLLKGGKKVRLRKDQDPECSGGKSGSQYQE